MEKKQEKQNEGKSDRLEIRLHPAIKLALKNYCTKNYESTTEAVTRAIKQYIGFEKK
jgi:hypothetical protein